MCLRILHVIGIMSRGGAETLLMNLYRNINREQIQFDFAVHSSQTGTYDDEIRLMGGKIIYFPHYNGRNHFIYKKKWELFLQNHPEYLIIHGHLRSTAAIYLNIAKQYGRITIAHSHSTSSRGNYLNKLVKCFMQFPIRHIADYFFACSNLAGIWLFGQKVCAGSRFYILNNAIDSEKFIFSEEIRNKVRKEFNIENTFVIGHVGNFDCTKNHSFIIDIFEAISHKYKESSLVLIGGGSPELIKKIKKAACQKGLRESIRFLGIRNDVNELLNAFDVFLFPSIHEGLGIAAVEAQANGLKCVLSDRIPSEVKMSENLEFLSLKSSSDFWAEQILVYKDGYIRKNMQETIKQAGYDISYTALWLTNFYLNII